jgi:solute carrier family 45 protein 1/2/4
VFAGSLLPHLARRDHRLIPQEDEDEDVEVSRLRNTVREWRAEATRHGKPLRLPITPFLLRNIWTGALLLFTILTFSTFFVSTVVQVCVQNAKFCRGAEHVQATVVIGLIGICWAVACWVPFAIIMEVGACHHFTLSLSLLFAVSERTR